MQCSTTEPQEHQHQQGKQQHLHIDVLFFHNILNVQHRIE